MASLAHFLDELQTRGRFCFTTAEAIRARGASTAAVRASLRRLKEKRVIADPYRGFHVIVPPPYRALGCLPADQFVPDLMTHLGEPYYAGLLSAAAYHGAGHQAPMVFQVMVARARRDITCGAVRVDFIARQDMADTPVVLRNTATGVLRIASAEATALELVGYPHHCGYLNNIATVLAELIEAIDGNALVAEAMRAPMTWVQRLGFLLTRIDASALASSLDPVLAERGTFPVALAPWRDTRGAPRDPRWNLILNVEVEADL